MNIECHEEQFLSHDAFEFAIRGVDETGKGTTMDIAEQIHLEAQRLPKPLAREVLDFIGYLAHRHGLDQADSDLLKAAQEPSMRKVWDNPDDEVWNDL